MLCFLIQQKTVPLSAYCLTTFLATCLCSAILLSSCQPVPSNSSQVQESLTIPQIFEIAKQTSGYTWYKRSDALLGRTSKSGHIEPWMRTRYNTTASSMLDAGGKVREGVVFPEGSIITKELINADRSINGYALMIKRKSDINADADGWVWGYVTASGAERHPLVSKGSGCINCHSIAGHIDRTLMNVSVP